jgi:hypothetical protein
LTPGGGVKYKKAGQSSESQDKEVPPMERFLFNVATAIVAGVVVALIVKWLNQ